MCEYTLDHQDMHMCVYTLVSMTAYVVYTHTRSAKNGKMTYLLSVFFSCTKTHTYPYAHTHTHAQTPENGKIHVSALFDTPNVDSASNTPGSLHTSSRGRQRKSTGRDHRDDHDGEKSHEFLFIYMFPCIWREHRKMTDEVVLRTCHIYGSCE